MAMLPPNKPWGEVPLDFDPTSSINIEEYAIGGKMITVKGHFTREELKHGSDLAWRAHIRQTLAHKLAIWILENQLCETTSYLDPATHDFVVAARCYLAPKDQVRILRVHKP